MRKYLLALVVVCSGCATTSPTTGSGELIESTPRQVAGCELVKHSYYMSSFYGIFAEAAVQTGRRELTKEGLSIGATHVVWEIPQFRYGSTVVTALLYNCHVQPHRTPPPSIQKRESTTA